MLIDTHTHVIAGDQATYPLNPGYPARWYIDTPISAERFMQLMNDAGVAASVLVQAYGAYQFDNRYALDSARKHAEYFTSVVVVDPADEPAKRLAFLVNEKGARGVRLLYLAQPSDRNPVEPIPRDSAGNHPLHLAWQRAIELGIPICVQVALKQGNYPWLRNSLDRFRGTPVILDHCGHPDFSDGPPFRKANEFWSLGSYPEVHLKATSYLLRTIQQQGVDIRSILARMNEEFGAARMMWGSNYCYSNEVSYEELVETGRYACSGFSPADREFFQSGTALKFWPELRKGT